MAHLFSKNVIADALKNINIPDIDKKISILKEWNDMYSNGILQKKNESEFEWVYGEKLFWEILWYSGVNSIEYNREMKPKNISNGQKSDIWLGFYSQESSITQVVIELKGANTLLDSPQQREWNLTPIQQAFKYKPLYNSKWVVVSNFFEIRLYTDTYQDFESFTLKDLTNEQNDYENFRKFYILFHAERLIKKEGESATEKLLVKVRIEQEIISKEFYEEYAQLREELMRDIWKNNPWLKNEGVIMITQKIIDRIVFIHFCEDRWLLPENKLKENLERAREIDISPLEMLVRYFRWIDRWSDKLGIPEWYNGGLFHDEDETISTLNISDAIITKFIDLGRYDFSDEWGELSVEILGHIFEQSISDLEEIREKIQNQGKNLQEADKRVSKRKKDGIFYTPVYIVDYIVRNSLGKYLEEHEEILKEKFKLKEDILEKNYRKREIEAYIEYQDILLNVKILDPACGSWAFLVRVFDFLRDEYLRVDRILQGNNQTMSLIEQDPSAFFGEILKNNIYWVDLNEESVEITKLSLWLKSAVKGKKLVTLDNNIKCGNSLFDNPGIAWEKAFDWSKAFPDIMSRWGFDVIVGNPPYGADIGSVDMATNETYLLFFDLWLRLLKDYGYMSYITPDSWLINENASFIREKFILEGAILSIYDVYKVFPDAPDVWCIIPIFKKKWIPIDIRIQREFPYNLKIFQFNLPKENIIESWRDPWFPYINNDFYKIFKRFESLPKIDSFFDAKRGYSPSPNSKNISFEKTDRQIIWWEDFGRYVYKIKPKFLVDSFEKSRQQIKWTIEKEFLAIQRIRTNSTDFQSRWLIIQYFWKWFVPIDSIGYFTAKTDVDLKYLNALLSSNLLNFYYKLHYTDKNVKPVYLKKFPIPYLSPNEQRPFIEKVDSMIVYHEEVHEKSIAFLKNISAKYNLKKITYKLEKWWKLCFSDFIKEIKVKITFEEQEELINYFEKRASEVQNVINRIESTDKEIDKMVFNLYGLTEEEKKMVLESK